MSDYNLKTFFKNLRREGLVSALQIDLKETFKKWDERLSEDMPEEVLYEIAHNSIYQNMSCFPKV